jgi:ferric-dicitrate binding protein FerR (iron transport regulator)
MIDVDWELVFRYFGNECSAEERERFERWLAADPQHQAIVNAAVMAAGRTGVRRHGRPGSSRLPRRWCCCLAVRF